MKLGVIGISPENGHPFSFSAIINGYDEQAFAKTEWQVILDYLKKRNSNEFGFTDVKITHAWTQDREQTKALCAACMIPNAVTSYHEMVGQVDGVLIARDDYESHYEMAKPFLDAGIPVYIDKPLTLDLGELDYFMPYISSGKLMTTSGFRFAKELDVIKDGQLSLGTIKLINATVLNGYSKYGIHMLDAISGLISSKVTSITKLVSQYDAFSFEFAEGFNVMLSCLGQVTKTFHLALYGSERQAHFDLYDNFSAFRRTLAKFIDMVSDQTPPIDPQQVEQNIKLLILGSQMKQGQTLSVY